ncbi:aminotransferase class I/II-fold pyridoxal phosphate-dependent enzyme [Rapidithrix thailandica]|uniref:Aminotransferase n=1 Tax=Rapidithrix thailandica TaxID=413964 RepID=A0AAW9RSN1_9BACT
MISSEHPNSLNLNVRGLSPSATLAINEKSNELIAQGKKVYKMGLGQSPFPVPESVVAKLREFAHEKDYLPVKGLYPLRQTLARFNQQEYGIECRAEDIMIGPGSKELIFILQLVYYGDLIIPAPGWVSYSPQARIVGRNVHILPTEAANRWQMTAEQLDYLCRTDPSRPRVVILNYPANPTGCTYSPKSLEEIAEVARKYKVILISDEIYGRLHFEGLHRSIAEFYPEGTIISSGLSKWCGAGGWRLGTFSFPANLHWLLDAMAIVASETYTSTSAPIQYAAIRAFEGGADIDHYLHLSRQILKRIATHLVHRLTQLNIQVMEPDGAFYLFIDFEHYRDALQKKNIFTSVELCKQLLKDTGIAFLPGHDFGRSPEELTSRLAFVNFEGKHALNHHQIYQNMPLVEYIHKIAPEVKSAMDQLEAWLIAL